MFHRLHVYTVHTKPGSASEAEDVQLVREGFSWGALLFTLLWALYHRLWLSAAAIFGALGVLYAVEESGLFSALGMALLQLAMQVVIGFHGNDWRRSGLKKRGYLTTDIVTGENQLRAQRRFFERFTTGAPAAS